jgi:hypothetical protein
VEHLQRWVDEFALWQRGREPLTHHLDELFMFQISLVGNGMGPAILIVTNSSGLETVDSTNSSKSTLEEDQMIREMQCFMERVLPTRDDTDARHPTATPQSSSRRILYRICYFRDACHVMSAFWNAVCELEQQQQPEESDSHIVLLVPNTMDQVVVRGPDREPNVNRWTAMAMLQDCFFRLYADAATTGSSAPRIKQYGSQFVENEPTLEEIRLQWQEYWYKVREEGNPMVARLLRDILDGLSDAEWQEIVHESHRSPVAAVRLSRTTQKQEEGLAVICCIVQMLQNSLKALRPKLPYNQRSVNQK